MMTSREVIIEFVLDQLQHCSADKKVSLFRALAAQAPSKDEAKLFHDRADYWERGASGDQQLLLNFKRRAL